jgi:hypothetical protein
LNFHIHKPFEAGFARKPNPKSEFCKTKKLKIDINRINIKLSSVISHQSSASARAALRIIPVPIIVASRELPP